MSMIQINLSQTQLQRHRANSMVTSSSNSLCFSGRRISNNNRYDYTVIYGINCYLLKEDQTQNFEPFGYDILIVVTGALKRW